LKILRRKLPWLVFTVLAVSFMTFMLTSLLPGDPARSILGDQATPEAIASVREDLGLDDPLPVRYVNWLGDALTGDLGNSYQTGQPVSEAIRERVPVTLQLGITAVVFALVVAVPLGILSAHRSGGTLDRAVTGGTFALLSIPNFMMSILLIYLFAVYLGWLPATGWTRLTADPWGSFKGTLLPAFALSAVNVAVFTRLLRTDMIATLQEDYVTMAEAKGLSTQRILLRHALRPSSFSLLTVVGIQLGAVIGGSVVVEEIFALPGVGRLLFQSILNRDLVMVQGVVLVISISYIVINFVVDLLYSYLDPRIRHGHARPAY
jgi:peptide/nickel transport system permease protein